MSAGYSFESFGAHIEDGVSKDTLYKWLQEYPEFSEAKKKGEIKSRHWWEEKGQEGMCGLIPGFVPSIWYMNMKNKFGYRDQVEFKSEHTEKKVLEVGDKAQELVERILGLVDEPKEVIQIREVKPIRIKQTT